jgi:DNA uptake protein ComE-like DNA-binding protein
MLNSRTLAAAMLAAAPLAAAPLVATPLVAQAAAPAGAPAAAARLNPNTATEAQLRALPQLTPAQVVAVVRGRPYATQLDFHKAVGSSLSAEQQTALYTALFVPLNLNTATREVIMLVPGMTPRMAHEFEEYRPYTSMDQFNREIGKYVPPAEVARLASYVTLR